MISDSTTTFGPSACGQCGTPILQGLGVCPVCELKKGMPKESGEESGEGGGERVGGYKIVRELGKGGFGRVYVAHQETPVERYVALKILQQHRQDEATVSRFLIEQQAMARMNHPNIAKIYDAGESGRGPFLAMELIEGEPITDYCDNNCLDIHDRLRLFEDVCKGVHHAHQNAVIHRDIKPSNILVMETDGVPVAKIIDFGVAKAIGRTLTDFTLEMTPGQVIGTPEYMSPEQALGAQDIDTRADLYSLGVLLYELLVGSPPFSRHRLKEVNIKSILDMIVNEQPKAPSEHLKEMDPEEAEFMAEARQTSAGTLLRMIRGDLDWIVMKAIEKDRKWRHDTAKGFLTDVCSYLGQLPLPSRKSTITYRGHKFIQRHRPKVLVAAAFMALLGCMGIGRWYQVKTARIEDANGFVEELLGKDSSVSLGYIVSSELGGNSSESNRIVYRRLFELKDDPERAPESRNRAAFALLNENLSVRGDERKRLIERVFQWLLTFDSYELSSNLLYVQSISGLSSHAYEVLKEGREALDAGDRLCAAAIAMPTVTAGDEVFWGELMPTIEAWNADFGVWLQLLHPVAQYLPDEKLIQWIGMSEGLAFTHLFDVLNERDRMVLIHEKILEKTKDLPDPANGIPNLEDSHFVGRLYLALLRSGDPPAQVWTELEEKKDPTVRSFIIHNASDYKVPPEVFVEQLKLNENPFVVTSVLTALSEYSLSDKQKENLASVLFKLFEMSRNDGVLVNVRSLFKHLEMVVPKRKPVPLELKAHNGHEMVAIDFPDRRIVMCMHETTQEQYHNFQNPGVKFPYPDSSQLPQSRVTINQWMRYCNWLSDKMGLDRCYEVVGNLSNGDHKYASRESFTGLTGFRMPTKKEWIFATQAGSEAHFPFGFDTEVAVRYVLFNQPLYPNPVGSRWPSAFGLFDTVGSLMELCFDVAKSGVHVQRDGTHVEKSGVVAIGLSHANGHLNSDTATGRPIGPLSENDRTPYCGLRIVRTLLPETSLPE